MPGLRHASTPAARLFFRKSAGIVDPSCGTRASPEAGYMRRRNSGKGPRLFAGRDPPRGCSAEPPLPAERSAPIAAPIDHDDLPNDARAPDRTPSRRHTAWT
jgi:hypothetical protein